MRWLRSLAHHARFRASLRARVAVDVALAVTGLALIGFGGDSAIELFGVGVSAIGAALLGRDLYRRHRRRSDFRLSLNPDFGKLVRSAKPPNGFERHSFAGATYVASAEVNALLNCSENPIELQPGRYRVPDLVWEHYERFVTLSAIVYNEQKVGLRTDLTPSLLSQGEQVRVQRTDYLSGVATNDQASQRLEHCGDDRRRQQWSPRFTMSDHVFDGVQLADLVDSTLSNHIGVTALLITADHRIAYQQQGDSLVDPRRFNLGSSGSLDLADLYLFPPDSPKKQLRTLQGALRCAMEREAAEETSAAVGPARSTTTLTGYVRYLDRGGKPEFFGIIRTTSNFAELKPSSAELGFVHRILGTEFEPTPAGLIAAIDQLHGECEAEPAQYSPSMAVGLNLARSHVETYGLDLSPQSAA